MPLYEFINDKTGERKQIIMGMNDEHVYKDDSGYQWTRVFFAPNAAVDTKIDPFSARDFSEKTGRKKGSIGNIWDEAQEASHKREKIIGIDPVKENYYKNYSKKRKNKEHQDVRKKKVKDDLSKSGVQIEW